MKPNAPFLVYFGGTFALEEVTPFSAWRLRA